ncbi:phosphotransferase [Demequina zhanjiangensis]|uniref:Phosphotransferase n=1 Tax=Demequina zhanjiangensis TaxID=3051659 RepID=A0ABT8FZA7_9MICO|nr:TIM barrel protein [Demequina sp. SYSU T00b26]MDN4472230.1 phosphotransferase [Demequina sp. SYSU T00b26]
MTLPSRVPPERHDVPAWAVRDQIAATHLRFDAIDRDTTSHATMLRRLGLHRVIWDRFSEDPGARVSALEALRREGVTLDGVWVSHPLPDIGEPGYEERFGVVPHHLRALMDTVTRRGMSPDLWVPLSFAPPGAPAPLPARTHRVEVERAADHLVGLARLAHGHGLCLVLVNHGGWAGEPQTMLDIVAALERRGLKNVGIGLQLQHAQHHTADLDQVIEELGDSLVAIVLSGMDAGAELSGRLMLPFGAGSRDRWVTHALVDSGWNGRVVVHAAGHDDAEARLADSLEGLEWAVGRLAGARTPRPAPRIVEPTWPPGWAWRPDSASRAAGHARPPKAPLPTPYGQPEPRRDTPRVDSALAYLQGSRGEKPTPTPTPTPRATPEPAPTSAAAPQATPTAAPTPTPPAPAPALTPASGAAAKRRPEPLTEQIPTASAPAPAARPAPAPAHTPAAAPAPEPAALQRRAPASHTSAPAHPAPARPEHVRPGPDRPTPARPLPVRPGLDAARAFLPRRHRASLLTSAPLPSDTPSRAPAATKPATSPIATATERSSSTPPDAADEIRRSQISDHAPDPYSGALHALLTHLESVGFTGAPRSFGWDDQGRHLVEFVPGTRVDDPRAPAAALDAARIGRFVRDMHDALASFRPPVGARWFEGIPSPGHDLIVHQDLSPSNIVVKEDGSLAAIDWDAAAPGTRLWDLAQVAHSFAPLYSADSDLRGSISRLRGIADGYGLDEADREALVPLLAQRSARMYDYLEAMLRTGQSPWVELWERGIGTVWRRDAAWIHAHEQDWHRALLDRVPAV